MMGSPRLLILTTILVAMSTSLLAQTVNSALRGPTPLNEVGPAAAMTPQRNSTEKEARSYPEQPPVIPHSSEGYQIDMNGNKCLSCHARARTAESLALENPRYTKIGRDLRLEASVVPGIPARR